jgi:hypothetical protein
MKRPLSLVAVLALAIVAPGLVSTAAGQTSGNEIPRWLAESETYGFNPTWEEIDGTAWKFVTHVPHTAEYLGAARAKGVRAFPYVTFYQLPLNDRWQGIRLSEHPDWILINARGEWAKTGFWESEDSKNIYCTCANVVAFQDAVLAYVETLMKRGAAGIFLDNVHPNRECAGEKFGKHKHLFPTQIEAFAGLMARAREVIRKYDPDGALLINSANPASLPAEFWPATDSEMSESYICTWVSKSRWGDWAKDWNGLDKKVPAGKQVCCLSYVGHTTNAVKDDLYFCYASARLMNFIWSAGNKPEIRWDKDARLLYATTLGRPAGGEIVVDGLHYRKFANGIVAVNPTDAAKTLTLEAGLPTTGLRDLYEGRILVAESGRASLPVPPQSGRVWLFTPAESLPPFGNWLSGAGAAILEIRTEPGLGKTSFTVDGLPYMTHAGRWTTTYVKGDEYGSFFVTFDGPGVHDIEVRDVVRKSLLVANSYEEAYLLNETEMPGATAGKEKRDPARLGKLMDPSDPVKFSTGEAYRFVGWDGAVKSAKKKIRVEVKGRTVLTARYEKFK